MFWIAFAAQLSAPLPADAIGLFSGDDMPAYVQLAGVNRYVPTRTTVGPDGKVQDCAVERSSGDAKLDAHTCSIILKRAKFKPAKWLDGSPTYAVIRAPVSWQIGGPASEQDLRKAYPPDIELSVTNLPRGAHSPTTVHLIIAVDETGHVVGCDEAASPSMIYSQKRFPELVRIACEQTMDSKFTASPAKDSSGKAVRSVQSATVGFETVR